MTEPVLGLPGMSEPGNITFVRWRAGESRRGRVFDTPTADHPAARLECALCPELLGTAPWQLLILGTLGELNAQIRHDAGQWYAAAAAVVHRACLDGLDDAQIETVIRSSGVPT